MGNVGTMWIEAPAYGESRRSTATPHVYARRARPRLYDQQIRSAICAIQLIAPLYCNGIFGTLGRSAAAYGSGMVGAVGHVAGAIRRLLRPRGTARRVSTISARPAERQSAEVDERDAGAHSRRGQLSSVSAL